MNEPTLTKALEGLPPADAQLLVDAEQRRREKAATTRIEVAPMQKTVEEHCAELHKKISAAPLAPSAKPDPRIAQATKMLSAAGIPDRHRHRIEREEHPWQTTLDKLTSRLGSGFIIAIAGIWGTGKTQLGSALIYAATDKLIPSRFAAAMEFFMSLKETYGDGSKSTESNAIRAFTAPKLLVLDEMDERSQSDWENRLLFHMINQRYNQMTDTLLISRQGKEDFMRSLGGSIQSRIQETGGCIECTWPSFREAK